MRSQPGRRARRTGSPVSSPSSNPEGTRDLKMWSERKHHHPPPPPPLLLVQPVGREVSGRGVVKCILSLSQTWPVPVKSGATGSGEALSHGSPIKLVEFMTQQLLILFCNCPTAASLHSPGTLGPSLLRSAPPRGTEPGGPFSPQDQTTVGLSSQLSSDHVGEDTRAATPVRYHRLCHATALVTGAAGFAWPSQQDPSFKAQGPPRTLLRALEPRQLQLTATRVSGLRCEAPKDVATPLPKPSLWGNRQTAPVREAWRHVERLPGITEGAGRHRHLAGNRQGPGRSGPGQTSRKMQVGFVNAYCALTL